MRARGVPCEKVFKVAEGRPHIVDKLIDGEIALVFNTTSGRKAIEDSYSIRRQTLLHGIPYFTALTSCRAAVAAVEARMLRIGGPISVRRSDQCADTPHAKNAASTDHAIPGSESISVPSRSKIT